MSLTRSDSFFEDFRFGQVVEHRRGRTFTQEENARWSLVTMNTAQAHWNHESMKTYFGGRFEVPLMNAALVLAVAVGLTSQDISENAWRDLGYDKVRIPVPAVGGDTVFAISTVVWLGDHPEIQHSGEMHYRIELRNQKGVVVCELLRRVLLKRRSSWQQEQLA